MKDFTLSIAQMEPSFLDLQGNMEKIKDLMRECRGRGSGLLVLPEMALTGYGIKEALEEPSGKGQLRAETARALAAIKNESDRLSIDVIVSYPEFSAGKTFIAASYVSGLRMFVRHRKLNLCNYAHYREHLDFSAGRRHTVARTENAVLGLLICEDFWHAGNSIVESVSGGEVLIVPSAPCVRETSQGQASLASWKKISRATAFLQTSFIAVVSRVGREGGNQFLGGSHVVSPDGEMLVELPLYREALAHVRLDSSLLEKIRGERPLLANEQASILARAFGKLSKGKIDAPTAGR